MPLKVLAVQATPNQNARKFVLNGTISEQPLSFFNAGAVQGHVLASRLFAIRGVSSVLLLKDFITVNKAQEADWTDITPKVKRAVSQSS